MRRLYQQFRSWLRRERVVHWKTADGRQWGLLVRRNVVVGATYWNKPKPVTATESGVVLWQATRNPCIEFDKLEIGYDGMEPHKEVG